MRGCGLLALREAADLDHQHRLAPRRRARRRHEFSRGGDAFDVEQDCAGTGIVAEIIEHVAEIDVGHIA